METAAASDPFVASLPVFAKFESAAYTDNYRPLPDGWALATADIVGSTKAIEAGRYKTVNMAGASVISALLNALGRQDLPFVFGGDGALVAFPGSALEITRNALAAVQRWVADELDLTLRAAIVPIKDIRAQGLDVRVARFQASEAVFYAMFAGGGGRAETEMKAGRYRIDPAPAGARPDLTGLSCRWNPIEARHGEIVSIIAVPGPSRDLRGFQLLASDIIALTGRQERDGHPVPPNGPSYSFPPAGLDIEARAMAPAGWRWLPKLWILFLMTLTAVSDRYGWTIGSFDPKIYKRDVASNSDFRKFDDGLKMTVDVDADVSQRIENRLKQAEEAGICNYGLHRQKSALMTCLVASPLQRDHLHFIDGAAGGYAMAAASLKAKVLV
ncbi:DUF3095 domain-containing protein [Mesorhizobium sp. B2-4-17]|uniref:DUF3095 domain-containing protein n=1 Tax=Mesorhizobium sp. B2-4-17 TaxID=2589932 RepID=UPI00112815F0|nr:DUF3095 domain-containing protein [Mesorhizobium sp. B2-4-17]TPK92636.1 DUF3095 domain-containing protein [Mesorhizobium sp. B2-4-17]